MRIVLRGRRYRFRRAALKNALGYCDPPDKANKEIVIDSRLHGQKLVEIVLHEAMHACQWDLEESAVAAIAHDCARLLAKLSLIKEE